MMKSVTRAFLHAAVAKRHSSRLPHRLAMTMLSHIPELETFADAQSKSKWMLIMSRCTRDASDLQPIHFTNQFFPPWLTISPCDHAGSTDGKEGSSESASPKVYTIFEPSCRFAARVPFSMARPRNCLPTLPIYPVTLSSCSSIKT